MARNITMIKYYEDLKSKTTKQKFLDYYDSMIEHFNKDEKAILRNRRYRSPVYVASLDKTFTSSMKASIALGKSRNYVYFVLKGKFENKYGIKQIN